MVLGSARGWWEKKVSVSGGRSRVVVVVCRAKSNSGRVM